MRLSTDEIEAILKSKSKIFGNSSRIFLFGSRVNDSLKGGDIDLYLIPEIAGDYYRDKIDFVTAVQEALGEQKIDLIIGKDATRRIEVEAMNNGIELDLNEVKLQNYLNQCAKHVQRIEEAFSDITSILPLNADKYAKLNKAQVQAMDQYLFRFSKLQDTLGDKVFRLIIQKYEPSADKLPLLDVLNKLEKYGVLENAKEWISLRKLRNDVAHQYEDEPEEMSLAINNLLAQKEVIVKIFEKIRATL